MTCWRRTGGTSALSRLPSAVRGSRRCSRGAARACCSLTSSRPADWPTLETARAEARARHVEGLMLKRRDSPYGTGRQRGAWWKWKVDPLRVDAVLVYAQAGSGRRANLFTDYTFAVWQGDALVPIAKAYSGLSDPEILALDRWIRRHTVERFGPVRQVAPEQVFELAFEGINRSSRHKSGIALRFPRIARWRTDKPAQEADRLEDVHALLPEATAGGRVNAPLTLVCYHRLQTFRSVAGSARRHLIRHPAPGRSSQHGSAQFPGRA